MYKKNQSKNHVVLITLIIVIAIVITSCQTSPPRYPCLVNFGTEVFPVQTGSSTDPEYVWAPDSKHILYRDSDHKLNIISLGEDDNMYNIPQTFGEGISWSSDGSLIAYLDNNMSTGQISVHLLDLNTGSTTSLTEAQFDDFAPHWSSNAHHLAFSREKSESPWWTTNVPQIYWLDVDDINRKYEQLTNKNEPAFVQSWSPDGTKIAYLLDTSYGTELHIVSVDTATSNLVTTFVPCQKDPSWSPDSSQITFASSHEGNWDIYTSLVEAGESFNLTNTPTLNEFEPSWSPIGQDIAFVRFSPISNTEAEQDIYLVDSNGNNEVRLTHSTFYESQPKWSPDGTKIAFLSTSANNSTWFLEVMNADGSALTRLATIGP